MSSIQQEISLSLLPKQSSDDIDRADFESNETLTHLQFSEPQTDVVTNSASVWSRGVEVVQRIEGDERYFSEKISRKDIDSGDSDSEISFSEGDYENFQTVLANRFESDRENIDRSESVESDVNSSETFDVTKTADDSIEGIIEINQKSSQKDAQKGKAILDQFRIWEGTLESRIHIQRALLVTNSLPHHGYMSKFIEQAGDVAVDSLNDVRGSVESLIEELVCLQRSFVDANKQFPSGKKTGITGDVNSRMLRYQNDVITEWEGKTKLLTSAFTKKGYVNVDRSVLQQIEFSLSKREDLLLKTQLKRLQYQVLGKRRSVPDDMDTGVKKRDLIDYDENIFDDTDFYHQLLQDLIHNKTTSNLGETGQKWLELNRNRSRNKRNLNTKASKGRKIRFDVYPKLVSFMAPQDNGDMNYSTRNELFRSIFGLSNLSEP